MITSPSWLWSPAPKSRAESWPNRIESNPSEPKKLTQFQVDCRKRKMSTLLPLPLPLPTSERWRKVDKTLEEKLWLRDSSPYPQSQSHCHPLDELISDTYWDLSLTDICQRCESFSRWADNFKVFHSPAFHYQREKINGAGSPEPIFYNYFALFR